MNRESITQEYLVLVTTSKGTFPFLNLEKAEAGLIAAGIMDLLSNKVITLDKKMIEVVKELPGELIHLSSLYEYLNEKKRSMNKVMESFGTAFTHKKFNQYYADIGDSLVKSGVVQPDTIKFFGNKKIYIPQESYKQNLIDAFKKETIQRDELQFHDIALASLLKETGNLNQYFSAHEQKLIKERIKEIRKNPDNKPIKEMIGYIDYMDSLMALTTMFFVSN